MTKATPWLCALASGTLIYLALGLGGTVTASFSVWWMLALIAPVPVLWFAFRTAKPWAAFAVALGAGGIGGANLLPVYGSVLPPPVLALAIAMPALSLAASVLGARFVARRLTPVSGVIAFAFLWTGCDYLMALDVNGATASPAYAEVEMPAMIQIASVFGLWGVTFVMALFAAALAMFAVTRARLFAALAAGVLLLNLGYGGWRLASAPQSETVRVGLAADDRLTGLRFKEDRQSAMTVVQAYAAAGEQLAAQHASVIVFPERVAVLQPEWQGAMQDRLKTLATSAHAVVIGGFDLRAPPRRNGALVTFANGAVQTYVKRHLVPGLEAIFTPGTQSFMSDTRLGVAICKDMDFPAMLRADAALGPTLYAVPAWDFDGDGVWHARLAILRGVENGFAVARAANNGLLTVSDAYGRVQAVARSATAVSAMHPGPVLVLADVPRGPGNTLYATIGDGLGQIAVAMGLFLIAIGVAAKRRPV